MRNTRHNDCFAPAFLQLKGAWANERDKSKAIALKKILADTVLCEAFDEIKYRCHARVCKSVEETAKINSIMLGILMCEDALHQIASAEEQSKRDNLSKYEDFLEQ